MRRSPRGKKRRAASESGHDVGETESHIEPLKEALSPPQKKRRGRPRKEAEQPSASANGNPSDTPLPEGEGERKTGDGAESIEEAQSSSKKKRRGRSNKEKTSEGDDGSSQNRTATKKEKASEVKRSFTCSHCQKSFSSKHRLNYHLDKKVCHNKEEQKTEQPSAPINDSPRETMLPEGEGEAGDTAESVKEPLSPPKKKRRGRSSKNKQQKSEGDDGSSQNRAAAKNVENTSEGKGSFACSHCQKSFSSKHGLNYHLNKKVCQQSAGQAEERKSMYCPHCGKSFSSQKRLARHIDKKVCQDVSDTNMGSSRKRAKPQRSQASKTRKESGDRGKNALPMLAEISPSISDSDGSSNSVEDGSIDDDFHPSEGSSEKKKAKAKRSGRSSIDICTQKSFHLLEPGSKFITKFGVVEVVADDRIPLDYRKSTIHIDPKECRIHGVLRERYKTRKMNLIDRIGAGTRFRREELNKMYLASTRTSSGGSSMSQKKVWDLYCHSLSPKQILFEGVSLGSKNEAKKQPTLQTLDPDPRFPREYYPDRIVKCVLVEDERNVVVGSYNDESDRMEYCTRPMRASQKKSVPIHLFIARRELLKEYDASKDKLICRHCNCAPPNLQLHLRKRSCHVNAMEQKEKKERRIEAVENRVLSKSSECCDILQTTFHGIIKITTHPKSDPPEFGNPYRIKDHKKDRMPPWLVFNVERSSMYPETYFSLQFKRGSQNRSWFNKLKQEDGYVSKSEKSRLRKRQKKIRMLDPGARPVHTLSSAHLCATETAQANAMERGADSTGPAICAESMPKKLERTRETTNPATCPESVPKKQPEKKQAPANKAQPSLFHNAANKPRNHNNKTTATTANAKKAKGHADKKLGEGAVKSSALPPLPDSNDTMEGDFQPGLMCLNSASDELNSAKESDAQKRKRKTKRKANQLTAVASSADGNGRCRRRKKAPVSSKKDTIVIDTNVLATECESGRYPTVNRFYGDHEEQCVVCNEPGEIDSPLIECDFCSNSVHQLCIDKRMISRSGISAQVVVRENEPHETRLCHECIYLCVCRRSRAENRRLEKWQAELSKAGLENAPEAARLTEEVNINEALGPPAGKTRGDDRPTYTPCPDGGPGGLICCSYCSAAYSRFLSNTTKEMEAQSVAKAGQEVSEILELLADAKQRLLRVSEVSESNEDRRGLLDGYNKNHIDVSLA